MVKYSFAQPTPKATNALKAVLMIFNSDPHLMKAVRPYIDMVEEEIDWNGINAIGFNQSKQCAVDWAYAIWMDSPSISSFANADKMTPFMKVAILEALCLYWGLRG